MGTLYVVATPIGNLKDISKRAIEILQKVDYIIAEDSRVSLKLLMHYKINKKIYSYHKFNEEEKSMKIIQDVLNGRDIALISDAGTPCISDPGYILIKKARENNINVIGLPGPCAVSTALSVSGLDTSSFSFYGFFPKVEKDRKKIIRKMKNDTASVKVFYESPKRIIRMVKRLDEDFKESILCICKNISKIHEKAYYGTTFQILEMLEKDESVEKGEYTVLISNTYNPLLKQDNFSLEAKLIDKVIKNDITLSDAVKELSIKYNKNDVYKASLNIKKIFK